MPGAVGDDDVGGVGWREPGYSALMTPRPGAARIWAAMKRGTEDGAMPANVLENIRPMVMAGLAKLVEEVNQ